VVAETGFEPALFRVWSASTPTVLEPLQSTPRIKVTNQAVIGRHSHETGALSKSRWKPEGGPPPSLRGSPHIPTSRFRRPFRSGLDGASAPNSYATRAIKNPPAGGLGGSIRPMLLISASIDTSRAKIETVIAFPHLPRAKNEHPHLLRLMSEAIQSNRKRTCGAGNRGGLTCGFGFGC
jgi:hypothetical protein